MQLTVDHKLRLQLYEVIDWIQCIASSESNPSGSYLIIIVTAKHEQCTSTVIDYNPLT